MLDQKPGSLNNRKINLRLKRFSRVEKAFYGSIVLSGILLAIGIIFFQTRLQQVRIEMADLSSETNAKQVELDEAKQTINELASYAHLMEIAKKAKLTNNNENSGVIEASE